MFKKLLILTLAVFVTSAPALALDTQARIDRAHTLATLSVMSVAEEAALDSADVQMAQATTPPAPVGNFAGEVAPVANEPTPVPEVVAEAESAVPTTDQIDSFGDLVVFLGGYIEEILMVVITWALRKLPGQFYAMFVTARWEQIARSAIRSGVNGVASAVDGPMNMTTGVQVLDVALVFVLRYAPAFIVKWVGGPEAVAEKLWTRLDLTKDATAPNFAAIAARAEQAVKSS
jgi:hypothetical protein